jgi:hypothetical protein
VLGGVSMSMCVEYVNMLRRKIEYMNVLRGLI